MCVFFFNDTATTEIYTLSLHDALPIYWGLPGISFTSFGGLNGPTARRQPDQDRKSPRLNSSHGYISHAVFCLKKQTSPSPRSFLQSVYRVLMSMCVKIESEQTAWAARL